ncbi:MAG TPA: NAD(P)/FAD-dependent oxidoreductase [Vineibacter sp.]|nr:NAD(P)/FAD-dependent oxidoreductase [Vineibacter sp.]
MQRQWDIVVIGAGPAGLSAAAVVARDGLACLCIDRLGPGGQLINFGALHDIPDLPAGTTGPDLVASLSDAAMTAGAELAVAEVGALRPDGGGWVIATDDGEHRARAVIIATGLTQGTLGIEGEAAFEGRGLSFCAACDGPLYAGQDVIVAGTDNWAMQEAIELAQVASRVILVHGGGPLFGEPARIEAATGLGNIDMIEGRIVALDGEDGLQSVTIARDSGQGVLPARAVFVYTQRIPAVSFARGLLDLDGGGHIMVDEDLRLPARTLFAAGDVRARASQRIVAAIADGERAGRAAVQGLKAG